MKNLEGKKLLTGWGAITCRPSPTPCWLQAVSLFWGGVVGEFSAIWLSCVSKLAFRFILRGTDTNLTRHRICWRELANGKPSLQGAALRAECGYLRCLYGKLLLRIGHSKAGCLLLPVKFPGGLTSSSMTTFTWGWGYQGVLRGFLWFWMVCTVGWPSFVWSKMKPEAVMKLSYPRVIGPLS